MLDLHTFKEHIMDELNGARTYIDMAIESKINHPSWSYMFCKMADMEADHAGNLMRMLEQYIKANPENISETKMVGDVEQRNMVNPEEVYAELMKEFGETMTYVTNMKRGL